MFQQGFFQIDPDTTPDQVKRKREAIQRAMNRGPAQYAGEGLTHLAGGIASLFKNKRLDDFEQKKRSEASDAFNAIFGPQNTGTVGATYSAAPPEVTTQNLDAVQIGNEAMRVLGHEDAVEVSPQERDLLARTIQAEAGNQGPDGMLAVGAVMDNRRRSDDYGNTFQDVIMAPGQFSAWNGVTGYAGGEQGQNMSFTPSAEAYAAADAILTGGYDDPTGGATHYFNPSISSPKWAEGADWSRIGDHVFGSTTAPGSGGRAGVRGGRPAMQVAQNVGDVRNIVEAMSDPWIMQDQGKAAVLQMMLQNAMTPPERMTPYQQAQIELQRQKLQSDASGGSKEYGLTPQFITTPDGGLLMLQLSKDGTSKVVDLPEGAAIQKGVEKLDLGTSYQWYNTITGEPIGKPIPKQLREAETEKAIGTAEGRATVERESELREMKRNMQSLETVVIQLEDLADKATYTRAGRFRDSVAKELGMDPSEGAVARAEYIAVVDNQVLPLLRQTFGAAFTAKEGETLRNTLGDPDKSPEEKKAVLRAFIAQKRRDIESRGGSAPVPQGETFESFSANPENQAAATKYGVSLQDMWDARQ